MHKIACAKKGWSHKRLRMMIFVMVMTVKRKEAKHVTVKRKDSKSVTVKRKEAKKT